jgi:hypothetical protein
MQSSVDIFTDGIERFGFKMNASKTKFMVLQGNRQNMNSSKTKFMVLEAGGY